MNKRVLDRSFLPDRFAANVDFDGEGDCWNWQGAVNLGGYGQYSHDGITSRAHRYAYEVLVGPIPEGKPIDHICFNRGCVNPSHLRPVTTKENAEHRRGPNANNPSGIRGVHWYERDQNWRVTIGHNGRTIHGGYFADISEAEKAAKVLRAKLFTNLAEGETP